jgi:co-chaperonin GroES (HSP10)
MATNINTITKKPTAVGNRVLVSDMHFGEQTTKSGLIISNDDGKTRGIYPRWAKVYDKGPKNNDPFNVGDWVLVEHGRWTRGIKFNINGEELEVRMVEAESILAYSLEKPDSVQMGAEYADGEHATIDPSSFVNPQY